ncbi:MAG: GNAT family N-acetyltransferase [Acidimicrobiia bacterium]
MSTIQLSVAVPDGVLLHTEILNWAELLEHEDAWTDLVQRACNQNPFAAPKWQLAWARHFVPQADTITIAAWNGERLVGIAPMWRHRLTLGPLVGATKLEPFGSGAHARLTELPAIVTDPAANQRSTLRAIVTALHEIPNWDWTVFPLSSAQGWFEPQWLPNSTNGFVAHRLSRPCVVLPLADTWQETYAGLKRNVRESIRRGRNRLSREDRSWTVEQTVGTDDLTDALDDLIRLHHLRSELDWTVQHADVLGNRADSDFFKNAVTDLATVDGAAIHRLRVDGEVIAALAVLHTKAVAYQSISGLDPKWWGYSPITTIQVAAIQAAIEAHKTVFNLSTGPDVAKLRWSENLEVQQEFVITGSKRRSRAYYSAYAQAATAAKLRRERFVSRRPQGT